MMNQNKFFYLSTKWDTGEVRVWTGQDYTHTCTNFPYMLHTHLN